MQSHAPSLKLFFLATAAPLMLVLMLVLVMAPVDAVPLPVPASISGSTQDAPSLIRFLSDEDTTLPLFEERHVASSSVKTVADERRDPLSSSTGTRSELTPAQRTSKDKGTAAAFDRALELDQERDQGGVHEDFSWRWPWRGGIINHLGNRQVSDTDAEPGPRERDNGAVHDDFNWRHGIVDGFGHREVPSARDDGRVHTDGAEVHPDEGKSRFTWGKGGKGGQAPGVGRAEHADADGLEERFNWGHGWKDGAGAGGVDRLGTR